MSNSAFTNEDVLEAARNLRPLLPDLLNLEQAQQVDILIGQLLNDKELDENAKVDALLDLICDIPETQAWLEDYLSKSNSRSSSLPGDPRLSYTRKYICPIGNDCTKFLEVNEEVPVCKTHLVPLVPENDER